MGMFDSIMLKVKCPICGVEKERECQTKDLNCTLAVFKKGDNINESDIHTVSAIVECRELCLHESYHSIKTGKMFYIEIATPFGLITGNYKYD